MKALCWHGTDARSPLLFEAFARSRLKRRN